MSSMHMLNSSKDKLEETRFSLPANVFLQPNFGCVEIPTTGQEYFVTGKYATLGRIKKGNNHKGDSVCYDELFACDPSLSFVSRLGAVNLHFLLLLVHCIYLQVQPPLNRVPNKI